MILPPGTYAQRRLASGYVLGELPIRLSADEALRPPPDIPAKVPIERPFTVGSRGTPHTEYRVYVAPDPEDVALTAVAIPLTEVQQTLNRLLLVEGLVIASVLAALAITGLFVVRLGLRPLDRMEVAAGAIAAGDLSRRVTPATERTEVGRLGLALNRMLDQLEKAFAERQASEDRLRQFLADASHELRTPLASIRGYAELFRMGAADGESTDLAMRRIEEESRRMGALVEDLLALARLDEEREPTREPVDIAQLATNAVEDARAQSPDRRIGLSAPASAVVSGDPHQLHQVLTNLIRNALVHTPPGSPIEVSVELQQSSVTVRVRDHGPGLPVGAGEQLFERFWRARGGPRARQGGGRSRPRDRARHRGRARRADLGRTGPWRRGGVHGLASGRTDRPASAGARLSGADSANSQLRRIERRHGCPMLSPMTDNRSITNATITTDPGEPAMHDSRPAATAATRHPAVEIVIPVYNEERVLAASIATIRAHMLEHYSFSFAIVIADNASTDGTLAVARDLARRLPQVRVLHLDAKGRGRALRAAWSASGADVLAYMDVDLSTDLEALGGLLEPLLERRADIAIGSRLAPGASVQRGARRELISRSYNLLLRMLLSAGFSDAQCGFKAGRREIIQALLPQVEDEAWFFDTELSTSPSAAAWPSTRCLCAGSRTPIRV